MPELTFPHLVDITYTLGQFGVSLLMLLAAMAIYLLATPVKEIALIRAENRAAAVSFCGTLIALALPLITSVYNSRGWIDLIVWGAIALMIQLLVYLVLNRIFLGLRAAIEADKLPLPTTCAVIQIVVAVLNAVIIRGNG